MGGLAALAREAGHRVTGCDAAVYPPMSEQLRALGIELIEGYGAEQLALEPDLFVVGNVVTRGNPLMEAILDAGKRYTSGPQWLADHILPGRHVLAVAGTHGKTTTTAMLAWVLREGRAAARLPGRRRAAELRRVGAPGRMRLPDRPFGRAVRDRGRRVRHRLLRQAQQVRPLPAAHRGAEQPRVRPRRHLRRPRGDRAPVPSPRAHRARERPAGRQRARRQPEARAGAGLLERGGALRRAQGRARRAARTRRAARVRRAARQPEDRPRRVGAARRTQPAQRAGRDRCGRACRRRRPKSLPRALASFQNVRRRLELRGEAARRQASTTTSPTTRRRCAPRSTACAASIEQQPRRARRRGRASWPCSSRARTR